MTQVAILLENFPLINALLCPDLQELDLEGDWDPSKHDAQMADLYDGNDAGDDVGGIYLPVFPLQF